MKHLLLISLLSLSFSQELKVEGNLNVTGAVINDSLTTLIDSLQTQITAQQTLIAQLESSNSNHESLMSSLQVLITSLQSQIASLEAQMNLIGSELTDIADCAGVIGGVAIEDCAGICNGATVLDACGICGGDVENEIDCSCLDLECTLIIDIDENVYETVAIGDQLWIASNLRVTHFNNGDIIQTDIETGNSNSDPNDWNDLTEGAYLEYPNLAPEDYGYLYNWYAVHDDRGICPQGWHIPSENEWNIIIDELGGETEAGDKMKSDILWNGNNVSGFNASPSGMIHRWLGPQYADSINDLWSSTPFEDTDDEAIRIRLYSNNSTVNITNNNATYGFSVRCLKD